MNLQRVIILFLLFILLIAGIFLIWHSFSPTITDFEEFEATISRDIPIQSSQFYANMRYPSRNISYRLDKDCSLKKQKDAKRAFDILNEKTILNLYETESKPEILITCKNIAPEPDQEDYFIAGEGGPTSIINTSRFAVIKSGKIALYRPESCQKPQVALHEILHALGFNHNSNKDSIMYQVTNCKQEIDSNIISEINRIYSRLALSDLAIEKVTANKTSRYLNFQVTIANYGLIDSQELTLNLFQDDKKFNSFDIQKVEFGARRKIKVSNLRIPRNIEKITFIIETQEPEFSKENNIAEIKTLQSV